MTTAAASRACVPSRPRSPGAVCAGDSPVVCMWDPFAPAIRELLLSRLQDPMAPTRPASGEPRCGTMEVDVPGPAKGEWALPGTAPLDIDGFLCMALIDWP